MARIWLVNGSDREVVWCGSFRGWFTREVRWWIWPWKGIGRSFPDQTTPLSFSTNKPANQEKEGKFGAWDDLHGRGLTLALSGR